MNRERITLTYKRDGVALQIKDVPAWVCAGCGKRLLTGKVATQVDDILNRLEKNLVFEYLKEDVARFQRAVSQVRSANLELVYA
ncbi:MAG: YgiT-type zinc finger protein [Anaerolineae bacterium]|nr:YgiT-type zinc finger protein [Anaerolineae bacterium]